MKNCRITIIISTYFISSFVSTLLSYHHESSSTFPFSRRSIISRNDDDQASQRPLELMLSIRASLTMDMED